MCLPRTKKVTQSVRQHPSIQTAERRGVVRGVRCNTRERGIIVSKGSTHPYEVEAIGRGISIRGAWREIRPKPLLSLVYHHEDNTYEAT